MPDWDDLTNGSTGAWNGSGLTDATGPKLDLGHDTTDDTRRDATAANNVDNGTPALARTLAH